MKYLLMILLSFTAHTSYSCLNESNVNKSGQYSGEEFYSGDVYFVTAHDINEIEKKLQFLNSEKPTTEEGILANQNDIAVNFIKLGKLSEAEKILNLLLKKYPNNYNLVVNIGTLYELQGKNKLALEYIKKAVILNPESHNKSEWFHIKILEFKLKNIPDDKIANSDILQLPTLKKEANEIFYQINHQLNERVPFTSAPNLLLAKIMQEYGDFLADSISIKAAYLIYGAGNHYDANHVLKFNEKRAQLKKYFTKYKEVIPTTEIFNAEKSHTATVASVNSIVENGLAYFNKEEKKEKENQYFIIGGIALCSLILISFLYRRNRHTT